MPQPPRHPPPAALLPLGKRLDMALPVGRPRYQPPPPRRNDKDETKTKDKLCHYWSDKTCQRGVFCTFAHGKAELGNKIDDLPDGVRFRQICRRFMDESCDDARCPYVHDQIPEPE